jgi:transcriptional regulator of met regulon
MTSICAFDIGIKNLSLCLMKHSTNDTDNISIGQWELINIFTSGPKCIGTLRNKTICGKSAKFSCKQHPELTYCTAHKKQYVQPECEIKKNKITSCSFVSSTDKHCSKKNCDQYIGTNAYCNIHIKQMERQFNTLNKLTKMKGISCMHASLYELGSVLYEQLDKFPEILQVDKVVIENQPSLKNPTMKSIEMMLFCYFIHHKFSNVKFVSPMGKLKINDGLTKKVLSLCKTSADKYDITKELSIEYCKELMNISTDRDGLMKKLNSVTKQDDLCDAFLHAYYHLVGNTGLSGDEFVDKTLKYFTEKMNVKKQKRHEKKTAEERIIKL